MSFHFSKCPGICSDIIFPEPNTMRMGYTNWLTMKLCTLIPTTKTDKKEWIAKENLIFFSEEAEMYWRLTKTADVLLEHFYVICSLLWYSISRLYFLYWNYWLTCWVPFLGWMLKKTETMALFYWWKSTSSSVPGISKVLKLSVELSGVELFYLINLINICKPSVRWWRNSRVWNIWKSSLSWSLHSDRA